MSTDGPYCSNPDGECDAPAYSCDLSCAARRRATAQATPAAETSDPPADPCYVRGEADFSAGRARDDNPFSYTGSPGMPDAWYAGWDATAQATPRHFVLLVDREGRPTRRVPATDAAAESAGMVDGRLLDRRADTPAAAGVLDRDAPKGCPHRTTHGDAIVPQPVDEDGSVDGRCALCGETGFPIHEAPAAKNAPLDRIAAALEGILAELEGRAARESRPTSGSAAAALCRAEGHRFPFGPGGGVSSAPCVRCGAPGR